MASLRVFVACFSALIGLAGQAANCWGQTATENLYVAHIKPLFRERCFACHGSLAQKGKLRLDTAAQIRAGGRSGPLLANAQNQLLDRLSRGDHEAGRMPMEGKPLSADEVSKVRQWVIAGAPGPVDEKPETDPKSHWAFLQPTRPALPLLKDPAWMTNPVDRLVGSEHQRLEITPLEVADAATLLRRVYLDLIGLPPTGDELRAYLADATPDAYERTVDRLLNDPRHAERWARHWMDVWRYSDWYGRRSVPDVLNSYAQIWRWRDWIVNGLRQDRPYDEMVQLMLAADELAPTVLEDQPATGFVVRNFYRWNYNNWMRDSVEHTAKAFLGLTLNCCHCHDHKYDPIRQKEYFAFRAIFEPVEIRHERWPGEDDPGAYPKYSYGAAYKPITTGMVRVMDDRLTAATRLYSRGDERNIEPGAAPIPPGVPAAMGGAFEVTAVPLPPEVWYPGLRAEVRAEELAKLLKVSDSCRQALLAARAAKNPASEALALARLNGSQANLQSLRLRLLADDAKYRPTKQSGKEDPATLARAAAWAEKQARAENARATLLEKETHLADAQKSAKPDTLPPLQKELDTAKAGLASALLALENPGDAYSPLGPIYQPSSTGRRAALARWITSPQNPLTARVAVNHLWAWHFGQHLVSTPNDLGRAGKPPANQALLDWLAMELMQPSDAKAKAWSMKRLHRLIVTSRTYKTSSGPAALQHTGRAKDPVNLTLWHFPLGRMEAEVIRDSLLHVAGDLDPQVGGPDIPQDQALTSRRRSLYLTHHGESRAEFLELFDEANPCEAYKRFNSVLPQQALAMANSSMTNRLSRLLAASLAKKAGTDEAFIRAAFQQVLGRDASADEAAASAGFLKRVGELAESQAKNPAPEKPAKPTPLTDSRQQPREYLILALFNHTDFLTIR
jgi:mono/diheme cytochrome c family protein